MSQKAALNVFPTISEYLHNFLYFMAFIKSASPETLRSYRVDLAQAFQLRREDFTKFSDAEDEPKSQVRPHNSLPPLPDDQLLKLCRDSLSRWKLLAPSSRNRKAATLKSFLNWLHDQGLIERDLALQIHSPRVPQRLPHHLSVDEALALIESLKSDLRNTSDPTATRCLQRDFALILLLYGGGLRVSEACGLEWSRVDLKNKRIRVLGKGGRERIVALPTMVITALKTLCTDGDTYVFGAEPLSTRVAYEIVRSRGTKAGLLNPLHPHALRHSYATHLLSSGANLRTLQELLGHRTLQATQRYTHMSIDQLARTMEAFHPLSAPSKSRRKRN